MMSRNCIESDALEAAVAFAATLTSEQAAELHQPYLPQTVRRWSNLPQATLGRREQRLGLSTATLSEPQWHALLELMQVTTSAERGLGLDRICAHLDADDHLLDFGGRWGYGRGQFVVAYLGTPSSTSRWQLQFGGHHLALARTFVDGVLTGATPAFYGIEPFLGFETAVGPRDPERASHQALADVLGALSPQQLVEARFVGQHVDLLLGPGCDWAFPTRKEGLAGTALTPAQRRSVARALRTFTHDLPRADAERVQARYESELQATQLGFSGSPELADAGDYVRIDGPSVWLELSMQDGINCPGPHPHAVWRDRNTDYGGTRF